MFYLPCVSSWVITSHSRTRGIPQQFALCIWCHHSLSSNWALCTWHLQGHPGFDMPGLDWLESGVIIWHHPFSCLGFSFIKKFLLGFVKKREDQCTCCRVSRKLSSTDFNFILFSGSIKEINKDPGSGAPQCRLGQTETESLSCSQAASLLNWTSVLWQNSCIFCFLSPNS